MAFWEGVNGEDKGCYCVMRLLDSKQGLAALKALFPAGEADAMNFVLFSTSGVHGSYRTIEEEQEKPGVGVTFVVTHPRLVAMRYGIVFPESEEDFTFLKKLRATSQETMVNIGSGA